jgi:hypothetical protein
MLESHAKSFRGVRQAPCDVRLTPQGEYRRHIVGEHVRKRIGAVVMRFTTTSVGRMR